MVIVFIIIVIMVIIIIIDFVINFIILHQKLVNFKIILTNLGLLNHLILIQCFMKSLQVLYQTLQKIRYQAIYLFIKAVKCFILQTNFKLYQPLKESFDHLLLYIYLLFKNTNLVIHDSIKAFPYRPIFNSQQEPNSI